MSWNKRNNPDSKSITLYWVISKVG